MALVPSSAPPPGQPQAGIVGQALSGLGGLVGKGLGAAGRGINAVLPGAVGAWNQIGTDPAMTRAAQVAAFTLLGGGGDTKKNISRAGLAGLQTLETMRQQIAAQKEQEELRKQEEKRYQAEQERLRRLEGEQRAQQIYENIKDKVKMKEESEHRNRIYQLELEKLKAMRSQGGQTTAEERKLNDLEERLKAEFPDMDPLTRWAVASQLQASPGQGFNTQQAAVSIYGAKSRALAQTAMPGSPPPDDEQIIRETIDAVETMGKAFGTGRVDRLQLIQLLRAQRDAAQQPQQPQRPPQPPTGQAPEQVTQPTEAAQPPSQPAATQGYQPGVLQRARANAQAEREVRDKVGKRSVLNGQEFVVENMDRTFAYVRNTKTGQIEGIPMEAFKLIMDDFQ